MIETTSSTLPPTTGKNTASPSLPDISPSEMQKIQQRYAEERDKRQRPEGLSQYISLASAEDPQLKRLLHDPWDGGTSPSVSLEEGARFKVVILGAGFGGLLFAVRLLQTGCLRQEEIVLVDVAAGFGGTWYWNRYPGLMCDIESYIYLPLLEETGYIPKRKYASGEEIREHAQRIAAHWSLEDRAMWRTQVNQCSWSDEAAEWSLDMTQFPPPLDNDGTKGESFSATVHADFVILAPGPLNLPKVSDFAGFDSFQGSRFLASRWDYDVTGGSPETPVLSRLGGKRVGIIGTGATGIQIVPELAKWCQQLYVFQRTPAQVGVRDQRSTDLDEWTKNVATGPGWQMARFRNFVSFTCDTQPPPPIDLVADGWTSFRSLQVLGGGGSPPSMEEIPAHITKMHAFDLPRAERIRARVDEIIHDRTVAEQLKAWYPSWCKRPCFHDEYLPTFNQPHVRLVDTNGKGVQAITPTGVVANGEQFDVDVLILAMGYDVKPLESPGARAKVSVFGRAGRSMDEKWVQSPMTLHGVATSGFPNMFFSGVGQTSYFPSYTATLDTCAKHVAFVISEVIKRQGSGKMTIQVTQDAETAWGLRVQAGAPALAALAGCTPSYLNAEGSLEDVSMEERMKLAASARWPHGMADWMDVLEEWRDAGDLAGLQISVV
ncbi:flavin-containing monooxygenase [Aspergillus aculeatinus CBS 121060]|uniref:Monooxygenase n=1 Tax=Aspergillus aculeatinus CBS 121060 TaxID=1448322 RepID=A0ACD1HAX7_9EURO|nr:monooxygenase [Aspergillus aculeatinus CBS 121060]RAH70573.1 monooxygenase [Aspergillus aculeatinus CBS 121060]